MEIHRWLKMFLALIEFREKNPDRWPKRQSADPAEAELGDWYRNRRHDYRTVGIEETKKRFLDAIGFNWPSGPRVLKNSKKATKRKSFKAK